MSQSVDISLSPTPAVSDIIARLAPSSVFIIADSNTAQLCLPLLADCPAVRSARIITIPAGEEHKTLDTAAAAWRELSARGCTRLSLIICVGGGMVTDLGGFVAATFKRGVPFVNVPTTLLGAVDASVGGKTGVNLGGLKNEVGAFREAEAVVISPAFFATLPHEQLLSGYGEMLKHAILIGPESLYRHLAFDISATHPEALLPLLRESVEYKRKVVELDPREAGARRALNFGHTIGHALESHALLAGSHVQHGIAVAWGIVAELVLSHMQMGFPSEVLHSVAAYVRDHYPAPTLTCDHYPSLLALMAHDKKNAAPSQINFTLLRAPGEPCIDTILDAEARDTISAALDITRDLLQ